MATVFTDLFTVGADVNIESYGNWGLDGNTPAASFVVNAANDRVQDTGNSTWSIAYITAGAANIINQEITATITTDGAIGLVARWNGGASNGYALILDPNDTPDLRIDKWVGGSFGAPLASVDQGHAGGAHTMRLKVTGTATIEVQVDAAAPLIFTDGTAPYSAAGPPGIITFSGVANTKTWDNIVVTDAVDVTWEQEGYRWRNDDGTEAAPGLGGATYINAQDTPL